jgi:hypothetical protein
MHGNVGQDASASVAVMLNRIVEAAFDETFDSIAVEV